MKLTPDKLDMHEIWVMVESMIDRNLMHVKRKRRLQEFSIHEALARLLEEGGEVSQAVTRNMGKDKIAEEIGDLTTIVIHLCKVHQISEAELAKVMYEKLNSVLK